MCKIQQNKLMNFGMDLDDEILNEAVEALP